MLNFENKELYAIPYISYLLLVVPNYYLSKSAFWLARNLNYIRFLYLLNIIPSSWVKKINQKMYCRPIFMKDIKMNIAFLDNGLERLYGGTALNSHPGDQQKSLALYRLFFH